MNVKDFVNFRKPSFNNFIVVHLDIALLISFGIAT